MGIINTNVKSIEDLLINTRTTEDNRYNLMDIYTFSIDANRARRFDDAISIIENDSNYLLFVHVTDIISNENYHDCNLGKFKDLVTSHNDTHKYDFNHSLKEGVNRNSITLITLFDKEGTLVEYKFIKAIINVDKNLHINSTDKYLKSNEVSKNACLNLRTLFKFYEVSKLRFRDETNDMTGKTLLEEYICLYTHLLGMDLIKKNIGSFFRKVLIKKDQTCFYVKATSPLYKAESYINQLLIHDFVVDYNPSTMEFWRNNKTFINDFINTKVDKVYPKKTSFNIKKTDKKPSCKSKQLEKKEKRLKQNQKKISLSYINYSLDC